MLLQGAFKWGCDCENRYTKATSVKYGERAVSLYYISKLARLTPCGLKEMTLYILNKNLTVLIKRIILLHN